jgi:hypothetical protein
MATRVELDLNLDMSAKRFPVWMALSIFSAVCLASVTTTVDKDRRDAGDRWVLSVTCISMSLSFIATVMYLISRGLFVGQMPEAAMVRIVLYMCVCVLCVVCVLYMHIMRSFVRYLSSFLVAHKLHTYISHLTFSFCHIPLDWSLDCVLGRWFARHYEPR